nr:M15 family metallopeptidase [Crassaminicella profunda]
MANEPQINAYEITMKRDLLCLMMAYPENIIDIEKEDNKVYIVIKSGAKIIYDDKKLKNYQQKLDDPDLQDMMEEIYPLLDIHGLMDKNCDPGRIRVYPLLKEVYGKSKHEIESNLKNVRIGYKNYPFNTNNKAAKSLKLTMKEIVSLAEKNPKLYAFIVPASGTFNYRLIAGTNRLSPHSFGTAIDLRRDKRDYWKWTSREEGEKRLNAYPREIVRLFEKNNFIWGGKWAHFDILHFEYRPELILKARYFSRKPNINKPWYNGISPMDTNVKTYIQLIDKVLSEE